MLTVHYSNRVESLLDAFVGRLQAVHTAPLVAEQVVVQNTGMSRWLSLQVAHSLGVAANIQFSLPAGFLWSVFQQVLGDVPRERRFSAGYMSWTLMALFEQASPADDAVAGLDALRHYLAPHPSQGSDGAPQLVEGAAFSTLAQGENDPGPASLKQFELCRRLAQSFDQYLVYRPDWIEQWSTDGADLWQARLWCLLQGEIDAEHWVSVQQRFHRVLDSEPERCAGQLPRRVSVFAVTALSPGYLSALAALAEVVDIDLYLLNPCREYWGDIVSRRVVRRREAASTSPKQRDARPSAAPSLYLETGNSLLAALGRQGRDMIDQLQEFNAAVQEVWLEPDGDNLLGHLQADMLHLRDRAGFAEQRVLLPPADRSLQFHICHSAQREVEVLYDQLLERIARDDQLTPADILIMAPDIEGYAPYIDAIFSSSVQRLPYSIADRSLENESLLVEAFFKLLDLAESRYEVEPIASLLEVPAVLKRFELSEDDLPLMRHWLRQTGICWGIDPQHRAEQGLPAFAAHSWRAGLERLLLGYALPLDDGALYQGILPWGDIEGERARVLGQLLTFCEQLFALRATLAGERAVADWCELLMALCDRFFLPSQEGEDEIQALRDAVGSVLDEATIGGYDGCVPLALIKPELRRKLRSRTGEVGFLNGGVTFSGLAPLRGVPFKLVCLIGMNEGACPGNEFPLGFDLMAQQRRRGDRSVRDEDRYLFLEALCAAREQLYISYVGQDLRENSRLPPSVLVSELFDYLRANLRTEDGGDVVAALRVEHPLQPFSLRYFDGSDPQLFSYNQSLADAARISANRTPENMTQFLRQPLAEAGAEWREVELGQLIRFFTNPSRYLLQRRLGVYLESGGELLPNQEPFELDYFADSDLRQYLLEQRLQGRLLDEILPELQAASRLPHGAVGRAVYRQQLIEIDRFAERLESCREGEPAPPLELQICLGDFCVTGELDGLGNGGCSAYHVDKMRPWMWLRLWLNHLALCCSTHDLSRRSTWIAQDRSVVLTAPEQPEALLARLLALYWEGLHQPLHFFPKSAWAYVEAEAGKGSADPMAKARARWAAASRQGVVPESHDPYYRLLFEHHPEPLDERFVILATELFGTARRHVQSAGDGEGRA